MSLRDQINAADDLELEAVEVPEWNCTVFVRNITGDEIDAWQAETYQVNGINVLVNKKSLRARLLVKCLVDETGQRIYADDQAEELGAKNNKILVRLYEVAERLNAVTKKDVEDLAKNS